MRNLWLLPDTNQTGNILSHENGNITPLHKSITLRDLPAAITLGIPEEILESQKKDDYVYGQFGRTKDNKNIFLCSSRAGKDVSGRTVVITNLRIFDANEPFDFAPEIDENASPDNKKLMQSLRSALEDQTNESTIKIRLMLNAAKFHSRLRSFSSEAIQRAAVPPDWPFIKKNDKKSIYKIAALIIAALTLIYFSFTALH